MRATWILTALGLLFFIVPSAASLEATIDIPGGIPADGTPFDVTVELEGLPEERVEVRVWLGGEGWQASRTWNGSAFERSDRYVLAIEAGADAWREWVAVQANPTSTNHARLFEEEAVHVGVRVRGASGAYGSVLEEVEVWGEVEHRLVSVASGEEVFVVDEARGVVGHRSGLGGGLGVLEVAVERGFEGRVCHLVPCKSGGGVVLDRVGEGFARVVNRGDDVVDVSSGVVVFEGGRCALRGVLEPGVSLSVEDGGEGCNKAEASRGALWLRGVVVDRAPGALAWGDVVRGVDGGWAPWRLPSGVEPSRVGVQEVVGHAVVFGTRGEGLGEVLRLVEGARSSLFVATYLFTHPLVADALGDAAERGVDVVVLVEPRPVGGLSGASEALLEGLRERGVQVRWFGGPVHRHGLQHAKVVVADGFVSLVLTENVTRTGLPVEGEGNVGAGVGFANASLARRLLDVFGMEQGVEAWVPGGWSVFEGGVGLVVSPENAWRLAGVPAWIMEQERVDGLVLRVSPDWGARSNPWLDALVNASVEGRVRVLASGVPGDLREHNRLGLAALEGAPGAGDVEVRLSGSGVGVVHAKVLVGDESALVGSSNWGMGGGVLNREVNVLVMDAGVAGELRGIFEEAWMGEDRGEGVVMVEGVDASGVGVVGLIAAVCLAVGASAVGRRAGAR